jgi:cell wall assembly regulator SMI1
MPRSKRTSPEAAAPPPPSPPAATSIGTVTESWARIEAWLGKHAPSLLAQLPEGAKETALAKAEKAMGLSFPTGLRESWLRHDGNGLGAGLIGNWSLLSVQHAMKEHALMTKLVKDGTFDGAEANPHPHITQAWWSPAWIPVVSSGSGHLYCVDTAPPPGGTPGQVILFFHDDGKRLRVATSFAAWLARIADDLEGGVYRWSAKNEAFNRHAFLASSLEGQRTYG